MQRRFAAGRVEGATQDLAVDSNDTLGGFGEPRHEALKAGAELVGIEQTKDPAERVVARRAMLQGQKTLGRQSLLLEGALFEGGEGGGRIAAEAGPWRFGAVSSGLGFRAIWQDRRLQGPGR